MKTLKQYLTERLVIKKKVYNYFPKTREELKDIIKKSTTKKNKNTNYKYFPESK